MLDVGYGVVFCQLLISYPIVVYVIILLSVNKYNLVNDKFKINM